MSPLLKKQIIIPKSAMGSMLCQGPQFLILFAIFVLVIDPLDFLSITRGEKVITEDGTIRPNTSTCDAPAHGLE